MFVDKHGAARDRDVPERACADLSQSPCHALVPERVAVSWTGITHAELLKLVRDGAVKVKTIKRAIYVDLDSLEAALLKEFGT